MREYLHHFVAVRNTRAAAALSYLALLIPRCRTDKFSLLFLHAVVGLWNLLPSGLFSGGTLSSIKSAMNLSLRGFSVIFFSRFISVFVQFYSLPTVIVLRPFWFIGVFLLLVLCAS